MPLDRSTIDNAFRTVLARSATDAEAAQHAADAGQAQLQASLYGSAEYQNVVVPVAALYRMVLGRTPDPAGLDFWVNVVRDGRASMEEAAARMLGSGEAAARFSYQSDSDEQFVQALYHNALGRNVDGDGVKFWLNVLSTHAATRAAVAHAFAASTEYRGDLGARHFISSDTGAVAGTLVDGYIKGATVFADANGNGVWDPGEAKALTDALGHFTLENAKGTLVASGGTDVSTGLPSGVTHTAPAGSSVVNPLTSLQQAFIARGQDPHQAQQSVATLLGVALSDGDLGTSDPFAVVLDTSANAAARGAALALQGAAAKLENLLAVVAQVVKACAGDAATLDAAVHASLRALAAHDGRIDLGDAASVKQLIDSAVATSADAALKAAAPAVQALSGDLASILAAASTRLDAALATGSDPMTALAHVVQVQAAVQGAVAQQAAAAAAGASLAALAGQLGGTGLSNLIAHTAVGDLDPASNRDDDAIASVSPAPTPAPTAAPTPAPLPEPTPAPTPGPRTATLTAADALANGAGYTAADNVVVADSAAHIAALTPVQLAALGHVDRFDAGADQLTLDLAQAEAIGSPRMSAANTVKVVDTAANLAALSAGQIASLANVDAFGCSDASPTLRLSVAQLLAFTPARVPHTLVLVTDTPENIAAMSAADMEAFAALGRTDGAVFIRYAPSGVLTVNAAQARWTSSTALLEGSQMVIADTDANLAALNNNDQLRITLAAAFSDVSIRPLDGTLTLDFSQLWTLYNGRRLHGLDEIDDVTVADTGAALSGGLFRIDPSLLAALDHVVANDGRPIEMRMSTLRAFLAKLDSGTSVDVLDLSSSLQGQAALYDPHVHAIASYDHRLFDWPLLGGGAAAEVATLNKLGAAEIVRIAQPQLEEGVTVGTDVLLNAHVRAIAQTGPGAMRLDMATLRALDSAGVVRIASADGVRVAATAAADVVSDATLDGGALTVEYGAAAQSGRASGSVAGGALANGDTFALSDVDVISHASASASSGTGVAARDAVALAGLALSAGAPSDFAGGTIGDNHYFTVRGTLSGTVFTVADSGGDTLVLWDADGGAGVSQAAVVLRGIASVQASSGADGVLTIGATAALLPTVAQALAAHGGYTSADEVVMTDSAASIAALSAAQLAGLDKVDRVHATDTGLVLTVAQALALGNRLIAGDTVTVNDTAANIGALSATQLAALDKVDVFHATDGALTIDAAQAIALIDPFQGPVLKVAQHDTVVLSDSAANVAALASSSRYLFANSIDKVHVTDTTTLTLDADQTAALSGGRLEPGVAVHVVDLAAKLGSALLTDAQVTSVASSDHQPLLLDPIGLTAASLAKLAPAEQVQLASAFMKNVPAAVLADPHVTLITERDGEGVVLTASQLAAVAATGTATISAPAGGAQVLATADRDQVDATRLAASTSLEFKVAKPGDAGNATVQRAGATLATGDTYALVNVDRLIADGSHGLAVVLDTGMGLKYASFGALPASGTVDDGCAALVRGTVTGDLFTVDGAGQDSLLLWDGDPAAGAVNQLAVVVVGAPSLFQHAHGDFSAHQVYLSTLA